MAGSEKRKVKHANISNNRSQESLRLFVSMIKIKKQSMIQCTISVAEPHERMIKTAVHRIQIKARTVK